MITLPLYLVFCTYDLVSYTYDYISRTYDLVIQYRYVILSISYEQHKTTGTNSLPYYNGIIN